jgi:outer membrane receptor protein involved in Fe transport
VDYWSIKVTDAISTVAPELLIMQCGVTGEPVLCSRIHRSLHNGNLWFGNDSFVQLTNVNIGFLDTAGLDFTGNYIRGIGNYGSLDFTFRGTLLERYDGQQITGGPIDKCAGNWGGDCGVPAPKWKHVLTGTWTTAWDFSVIATWRYVGATDDVNGNFNPGERNYIDLAVSYTPKFAGFGDTTIDMGVDNIADTDPPVSGYFNFNGNTSPGTYAYLGRYLFFGVSEKF